MNDMEVIIHEMTFAHQNVPDSGIECVLFDMKYFDEYRTIYNDCFHEMRKALDIKPYDFFSDIEQIETRIRDTYLLLGENEIIGSVSCLGTEVDDLIVNRKYQGRGYGRKLLLWAMAKIRATTDAPITLHVAAWNEKAVNMYNKAGFVVTGTEKIR